MIINLDNLRYDIILHDLMYIAKYIESTGDKNAVMYQKRLMDIKEELRQNTETKD